MNDIDMWNDLEMLEHNIKMAKTKDRKEYWKKLYKQYHKMFVKLYIERK